MTRIEFLDILKKELKDIPKETRIDILSDYEEHFEAGLKKGKTENEICSKLGDPAKIAKELKAMEAIENIKSNFSLNNIFRVFITFSSLGLFNLVFIFPYFFIINILGSIAFVAVVLLIAGIMKFALGVMNIFFGNFPLVEDPARAIPVGILAIVAGFGLVVIDALLVKYFYKFTIRYVKMNIGMFKEEVKDR